MVCQIKDFFLDLGDLPEIKKKKFVLQYTGKQSTGIIFIFGIFVSYRSLSIILYNNDHKSLLKIYRYEIKSIYGGSPRSGTKFVYLTEHGGIGQKNKIRKLK